MKGELIARRGEVAALCGLILAGMSYSRACLTLRLSERRMVHYVAADLRVKTQPPRRWTSDALDELKEYWMANERTSVIADRFGVSVSQIVQLVKREGWVRRKKGPLPDPKSIRQQEPKKRRLYRKMRNILGAERAKQEMGL